MTKYSGGCHCGKVRYQVEVDLTQPVTSCNCSICSKKGHLLAFVGPENVTMLQGDGELTDYQFNKHNVHHVFCRTCGIQSFGRGKRPDGQPVYAINVRCLDGVDPATLTIRHFDGRSL
jgi:hypothetical protein